MSREYSINDIPTWGEIPESHWTNPHPPLTTLLTRGQIATMIEEAIRKALHPEGFPDAAHFLRVEATDQDGQRWRGMLYAVKDEEVPL